MEPPDVIYIEKDTATPRIRNFIALANWAYEKRNKYLYDRAMAQLLEFTKPTCQISPRF